MSKACSISKFLFYSILCCWLTKTVFSDLVYFHITEWGESETTFCFRSFCLMCKASRTLYQIRYKLHPKFLYARLWIVVECWFWVINPKVCVVIILFPLHILQKIDSIFAIHNHEGDDDVKYTSSRCSIEVCPDKLQPHSLTHSLTYTQVWMCIFVCPLIHVYVGCF